MGETTGWVSACSIVSEMKGARFPADMKAGSKGAPSTDALLGGVTIDDLKDSRNRHAMCETCQVAWWWKAPPKVKDARCPRCLGPLRQRHEGWLWRRNIPYLFVREWKEMP